LAVVDGSDIVQTQTIDNVLTEVAMLLGKLLPRVNLLKFGETLFGDNREPSPYGGRCRDLTGRDFVRSQGKVRAAW